MSKIPTIAGSLVTSVGGIVVGSQIVGSGVFGEADVIGLQSHEHNGPETLHQQLTREHYSLNLPQPSDMGARITNVSEISGDNLKFSSYKCFENFFPGAKLENNTEKGGNKNLSDATLTEYDSKNAPIGCSTMQLSYLQGQSKNGQKEVVKGMLFKSEIVAKNENEGMALWAVWDARNKVGKQPNKRKQTLNYRFVYLSKNNDDTWEVKRGYEWEDKFGTIDNISAHIQVPNGDLWLNTSELTKDESSSGGDWKYKEFAGIWRDDGDDPDRKGIFNDMEVRVAGSDTCEVMCKDFYIFSVRRKDEVGIRNVKYHYSPEKKKWFSIKDEDKQKVPDLLNKSYDWLKGKVGKWEDLNNVCSDVQKSEVDYVNDITKEELRSFCYSKNKTGPR